MVQEQRGINDVFPESPCVPKVFFVYLVKLHNRRVVEMLEQEVRLTGVAGQFFAEGLGVKKVRHPNALAVDLVSIRRADTPSRSPDLFAALERLARYIKGLVIRHDQVRVLADEQVRV